MKHHEKIVAVVLVERALKIVWQCWFCFKMAKSDGSEGFLHEGKYDLIIPEELIIYTLNDGRKSIIEFQQIDQNTIVRESFEPVKKIPKDSQLKFCQSVLSHFKKYTESNSFIN